MAPIFSSGGTSADGRVYPTTRRPSGAAAPGDLAGLTSAQSWRRGCSLPAARRRGDGGIRPRAASRTRRPVEHPLAACRGRCAGGARMRGAAKLAAPRTDSDTALALVRYRRAIARPLLLLLRLGSVTRTGTRSAGDSRAFCPMPPVRAATARDLDASKRLRCDRRTRSGLGERRKHHRLGTRWRWQLRPLSRLEQPRGPLHASEFSVTPIGPHQ